MNYTGTNASQEARGVARTHNSTGAGLLQAKVPCCLSMAVMRRGVEYNVGSLRIQAILLARAGSQFKYYCYKKLFISITALRLYVYVPELCIINT